MRTGATVVGVSLPIVSVQPPGRADRVAGRLGAVATRKGPMTDAPDGTARRPRVHVHLDHGRSPASWSERFARGEVGAPSSYGYEHASDRVELTFSSDAPDRRFSRLVRGASRRLIGFDLLHLLRNRRAMGEADAVWTHTEYEWAGVVLLRAAGLAAPRAVIAQSVWLWDRWGAGGLRARIWRWTAARADVHVTLSAANAAVARGLVRTPVVFVPFGIEPLEPLPSPAPRADEVVSVIAPGNDPDRDWTTLIAAARLDPGLRVGILSSRFTGAGPDGRTALPATVTVRAAHGAADVLASLAAADVVAVPIRFNRHASGITVALEAISAGRPLAVTDVGGIADYVRGCAELAREGDPADLARAIRAAAGAGRATDALPRLGLTARDYATRLAILTTAILEGEAVPDDVSAFLPPKSA